MKRSRLALVVLSVLAVCLTFTACTGSVPGAEVDNSELKANVTVQTKIVAPGMKDDGTDDVLLDREIAVTSSTKTTVSIKDLANTIVDENFLSGTVVRSTISDFGGYEATDENGYIWSWALNGDANVGVGVALKEGDTVVFSYLKGGVDETDGEEEAKIKVNLSVSAGADVLFDDTVEAEGTSISVKTMLTNLKKAELLDVSAAGSITSIGTYEANETNEWAVYVNGEAVNLRQKLAEGDSIEIVYEAKAA